MEWKGGNAQNAASLVLVSASPRRRQLLRLLGIPFVVQPVSVQEVDATELTGREQALLNATLKAVVGSERFPDQTVLGADTVVCIDGHALGKPRNLDHAREMLRRLSGREHQVITGVCLAWRKRGRFWAFVESTRVWFRPLRDEEIELYIQRVHVLDKAGAYAIQEHGEIIIERIEGSWSNVVGLPLERLARELEEWFGFPKGFLEYGLKGKMSEAGEQEKSNGEG